MAQTAPAQKVFILLPAYNDGASLKLLLPRIKAATTGRDLEIIVVDDGSTEGAFKASMISQNGLVGCVIELVANYGQQPAIAIGMKFVASRMSENDLLIVMDADGEDPAEVIEALIDRAVHTKKPVVAARSGRSATFTFRLGYLIFKCLFAILTGRSLNFGNFMCLQQGVVKRLVAMLSLSDSLPGTLLLSKLPIDRLPVRRNERLVGRSHMNVTGLIQHGLSCIRVFRKDVLIRLVLISLMLIFFLSAIAFAILIIKLYGIAVPGWTSLALGIVGIFLLQILGFLFLAAITQSSRKTDIHISALDTKLVKVVHTKVASDTLVATD